MPARPSEKVKSVETETEGCPAVRLERLTRCFVDAGNKRQVLTSVTTTIDKGSVVALRGRSGSGKSTLLNLISGIDHPDSGSVWLNGMHLTGMSERDRTLYRRRHIGFVYQAYNLVPTLSVFDNVSLVLELNGAATAERRDRVGDLLSAVDLADRSADYPDLLSGGEQQRVAIARALANRPRLILADEPTGNLDDVNAAVVLDLLVGMVRDRGATMIMATHSAAVAARCDRVIEIHNGRIDG